MSELKMVRYQLLRVESAIKSIVQYLIDALVKPSSKDTETRMIHLLPDNHIRGESNYYYVMTTIWYVITNYPEHALPWKVQQRGADLNAPFDIPWLDDVQHWKGTGLMDGDNRLPDDNYVFDKTIKIKAALLKWFHYGSVLNLIKFGAIPCAWAPKPRRGMDFEDTVRQLERKAKIALATQVATQPDYSERDEIVDRLAFVAGELQLDTDRQIWSRLGAPRWVNRRIDISDMASKRIMARDYSRELNPGLSSPDYDGVTSGPWEIHALCHHSRLLVVNQKYSEVAAHPIEREMNHVKMRAELEKFRGKLRWFLASDATLVPCWDRSSLVARRGWLRSEATSVLATTLIDICLKDLDRTFEAQIAQLRHRAESRIRGESPAINRRSTRPMSVNFQESDTSINTKLLNEFLDRKVVELDRGGSSSTPAIDWMAFKPPRRYHPDEFFTSLDDTDNLYKRKNIEAIDLPSGLRDFFNNQAWRSWHGPTSGGAGRVDTGPPGNHEGSASRGLPVQTGLSPSARASNLCGSHNAAADEHSAGEQHLEPLPDGRQKGSGAVYPDYNEFRDIINRGENLAFMSVVDLVSPDTAQVSDAIPLEPRIACTIKDRTAENSDEESEIKKLKKMLSDSLIDQGVQHRFIALTGVPTLLASLDPDPPGTTVGGQPQSFSKEMARNQLKLLAYVLHTESMDCLNSHLLRTSEFSCHKGNRWAARITVRSWKKEYIGPRTSRKSGARGHDVDQSRPNGLDENDPNLLAMEDLPIEMPEFLEDWLRENDFKARDEAYSHAVELKVSSIILSSNAFGDFTKGTIISQIIPKEDLLTLASHSLKLWQQFTHQPQTARCLVFLMILSFLCRSISRDTRDAVDYFAKPLELEVSCHRDACRMFPRLTVSIRAEIIHSKPGRLGI